MCVTALQLLPHCYLLVLLGVNGDLESPAISVWSQKSWGAILKWYVIRGWGLGEDTFSELHYTKVTSKKDPEDWQSPAAHWQPRAARIWLYIHPDLVLLSFMHGNAEQKWRFALRQVWEEMRVPSVEGNSSAGSQVTKGGHKHFRLICKMRLKARSTIKLLQRHYPVTEPSPCMRYWPVACTRYDISDKRAEMNLVYH